jgi:hypothetical protein
VTSIIECADQIPAIGFVELLQLLTTVFGSSRRIAPPRDLGRLYEAPRVKRAFRDQHFSFFPSVPRGSRERGSALMGTAVLLAWPR